MKSTCFIVNREDITQELIDQSLQDNVFTIRKSLDESKWILRYDPKKIPLTLYTMGYKPYTEESLLSEIENNLEVWQHDPA